MKNKIILLLIVIWLMSGGVISEALNITHSAWCVWGLFIPTYASIKILGYEFLHNKEFEDK
jgi:hypothetical protein